MKKSKLISRRSCLMFIMFLVILTTIWTYAYFGSKKDKIEVEERRLHKANLFENVKFEGDILHIEKSRSRGRNLICVKLKKLNVDSSNLIINNRYFNFDWRMTGLVLGWVETETKVRLMEMDEVRIDRNGKLMLYSSAGDSLDMTPRFLNIINSENSRFCRDFIE